MCDIIRKREHQPRLCATQWLSKFGIDNRQYATCWWNHSCHLQRGTTVAWKHKKKSEGDIQQLGYSKVCKVYFTAANTITQGPDEAYCWWVAGLIWDTSGWLCSTKCDCDKMISPCKTKFKTAPLARKVMPTVLWGMKGVILVGNMRTGTTINCEAYVTTLQRIHKCMIQVRICQKMNKVLLLHSKAAQQSANKRRDSKTMLDCVAPSTIQSEFWPIWLPPLWSKKNVIHERKFWKERVNKGAKCGSKWAHRTFVKGSFPGAGKPSIKRKTARKKSTC